MTHVKLLDVVALTADLPEYNLWRGQVGTIVAVLQEQYNDEPLTRGYES